MHFLFECLSSIPLTIVSANKILHTIQRSAVYTELELISLKIEHSLKILRNLMLNWLKKVKKKLLCTESQV